MQSERTRGPFLLVIGVAALSLVAVGVALVKSPTVIEKEVIKERVISMPQSAPVPVPLPTPTAPLVREPTASSAQQAINANYAKCMFQAQDIRRALTRLRSGIAVTMPSESGQHRRGFEPWRHSFCNDGAEYLDIFRDYVAYHAQCYRSYRSTDIKDFEQVAQFASTIRSRFGGC